VSDGSLRSERLGSRGPLIGRAIPSAPGKVGLSGRRARAPSPVTVRLLLWVVEGSILRLLEQHGSLAYEQIAAHLGRPPDAVRNALTGLRERGLIDVLSVGDYRAKRPAPRRTGD
jgi:hypothetical protein